MVPALLSPHLPAASADAVSAPASSRRRRVTVAVVAACLLAVPFVALRLQTGEQRLAANETSDAVAAPAAAPAVTDLRDLVTDLQLWDDGVIDSIEETSVSLHFFTRETDSLEPLLRALGFDPATMDRIDDTQAIDGTLTATAPHATASWSFEPDDGLRVVIQLTD